MFYCFEAFMCLFRSQISPIDTHQPKLNSFSSPCIWTPDTPRQLPVPVMFLYYHR